MSRKLTTYVHVDGKAWGPDDTVPAAVADKIANPDVWAEDAPARGRPRKADAGES